VTNGTGDESLDDVQKSGSHLGRLSSIDGSLVLDRGPHLKVAEVQGAVVLARSA
jgi:hypothetical protein